ncbi:MAG: M15 family metallopeptidase [Saprospiraceae bacterium]|nr:M15 family metallopeptidase [Saprospiraceae bacterium]
MRIILVLFFSIFFIQCKKENNGKNKTEVDVIREVADTKKSVQPVVGQPEKKETLKKYSSENVPEKYLEIVADTLGIILDIRYATENNFTKQQIYDCPRCFFRKEVAKKIIAIHEDLKERYGFGIKLFDCYRPASSQEKLWKIMPNPNYVTPPYKGSVHSRGMAADLTIVNKEGKELDMGTSFDFFGKEAHTDYQNHSDQVLKNRQLLKKMMEIHGFKGIRTEWWHYSYRKLKGSIDNWVWDCE